MSNKLMVSITDLNNVMIKKVMQNVNMNNPMSIGIEYHDHPRSVKC